MEKTKQGMLLGDVSQMPYNIQGDIIDKYLESLFNGELKDRLSESGSSIFNGISRKMTDKYMVKFHKMLKLNDYTTGSMENSIEFDRCGLPALEYIGFFVSQEGQVDAFASFKEAYIFANNKYLWYNTITGNISMELAINTDVQFGRIVIQNGNIISEDLESVVNSDFYVYLTNS